MTLYDELCSDERIDFCASKVYKSKSGLRRKYSRGIDGISIEKYFSNSQNIKCLKSSLRQKTFKLNKLKGISIPKENSSTDRLITAPTVEDRIIHLALLDVIHDRYIAPYINTGVSFCGVKSKLRSKNGSDYTIPNAIKKLSNHMEKGEYWVLKADIEKFFDQVPKEKLLQKIEILLPDNSLSFLLQQIIFFQIGNIATLEKKDRDHRLQIPEINSPIGISQGSALSPLFANIYLKDFDIEIVNKFGNIMIRYVDDLLIFAKTRNEIEEIKTHVEDLLKKEGLKLSPKEDKTYIRNVKEKGIEFLGLRIDRNSIREKSRTKILTYVRNIFDPELKEYQYIRKFSKKALRMEQRINGLFNYYRYYHTEKLVKEINKQIFEQSKQHPDYKIIKYLDLKKLKPIIEKSDWENIFKEKASSIIS